MMPQTRSRPDAFFLLFGAIWFGVGSLLFLVFGLIGGFPWTNWQLNSHGIRVAAQVLAVKEDTSAEINDEHPWLVRFRFRDQGGRPQEATATVYDEDEARGLERVGKVNVIYLADRPTVTKIAGSRYNFFPIWVFGFIGIFIVGGAGFMLWGVKDLLLPRR